MSKYPEHARMHAVKRKSQTIGEFLEWLAERGEHICWAEDCANGVDYLPVRRSIERTLALHFEIDLAAIGREKDAMLEEMRAANEAPTAAKGGRDG